MHEFWKIAGRAVVVILVTMVAAICMSLIGTLYLTAVLSLSLPVEPGAPMLFFITGTPIAFVAEVVFIPLIAWVVEKNNRRGFWRANSLAGFLVGIFVTMMILRPGVPLASALGLLPVSVLAGAVSGWVAAGLLGYE